MLNPAYILIITGFALVSCCIGYHIWHCGERDYDPVGVFFLGMGGAVLFILLPIVKISALCI